VGICGIEEPLKYLQGKGILGGRREKACYVLEYLGRGCKEVKKTERNQ